MMASVLETPNFSAHSLISFASASVSLMFRLTFRLASALGGRPVRGGIVSPHFCPCINNMCAQKSRRTYTVRQEALAVLGKKIIFFKDC